MSRPEVWTVERVRALGLTTDIVTAGAILGVGRSAARALDRRGEFPVPVLQLGAQRRVPVPALLRLLGLDEAEVPTGVARRDAWAT